MFLSRFMFMEDFQNFMAIGILVLFFTIISSNVKKFIVNSTVLYFFINFIFIYFCFRFSYDLLEKYTISFLLSMISTFLLYLLWSVAPYLVMKKFKDRKEKNQAMSSGTGREPVQCKKCGEKYLSNPVYCIKCLSKLEA
jgi:hypothetical protein